MDAQGTWGTGKSQDLALAMDCSHVTSIHDFALRGFPSLRSKVAWRPGAVNKDVNCGNNNTKWKNGAVQERRFCEYY